MFDASGLGLEGFDACFGPVVDPHRAAVEYVAFQLLYHSKGLPDQGAVAVNIL